MAITPQELQNILKNAFPNATLKIEDTAGNNSQYHVNIVSALFNDLSVIDQHKMVYKALGDKVGKQLHALSIKTEGKSI